MTQANRFLNGGESLHPYYSHQPSVVICLVSAQVDIKDKNVKALTPWFMLQIRPHVHRGVGEGVENTEMEEKMRRPG